MLDGSLKNVVDVEKLNVSLLANSSEYFEDKDYAVILHDPSDIRKPCSEKLEDLGKVKSLEGKLVNGYRTFNSIAVDLRGASLRLLSSSPYSSGEAAFVGVGEAKDYQQGQVRDAARRAQVAAHQQAGTAFNLKDILCRHIQNIDKTIGQANPEAVRVHVLDREFDDQAVFKFLNQQDDLFVIRAKLNRNANEWQYKQDGQQQFIKLKEQVFFEGFERHYEKVAFKKRVFQNAKGVFEYGTLSLGEETYSVVRVCFYDRKGAKIFKDPMLLITNMQVDRDSLSELVFQLYMKRSKIEAVFKFCKDVLGWESPRVRDFECFKNLLSLVYFVAGYFYEVEPDLATHPQAILLAKMGNGKGKVTPYYILRGLQKVATYQQMQQQLSQEHITEEQLQQAANIFTINSD